MFRNIIITLIAAGLIFSTQYALANQELQARKDLASLNIPYSNEGLTDAIFKGDELVVDLFIKAGYSLDIVEPFNKYLFAGIPKDALSFFSKITYPRPPKKYQKYELSFLEAAQVAGLKGTPLMLALYFDKEEIVDLLLKNDADVNLLVQYNKPGYTADANALSIAISKLQNKYVKILLEEGAETNVKSTNGYGLGVIKSTFEYTNMHRTYTEEQKKSIYSIAQELYKHSKDSYYIEQVKYLEGKF
jgi:hypothetical protein